MEIKYLTTLVAKVGRERFNVEFDNAIKGLISALGGPLTGLNLVAE